VTSGSNPDFKITKLFTPNNSKISASVALPMALYKYVYDYDYDYPFYIIGISVDTLACGKPAGWPTELRQARMASSIPLVFIITEYCRQ